MDSRKVNEDVMKTKELKDLPFSPHLHAGAWCRLQESVGRRFGVSRIQSGFRRFERAHQRKGQTDGKRRRRQEPHRSPNAHQETRYPSQGHVGHRR